MAGNDLMNMNAATNAILTNKDAIAIDQDLVGAQGYKIKDYGEFEIYYKPLQKRRCSRFAYSTGMMSCWM